MSRKQWNKRKEKKIEIKRKMYKDEKNRWKERTGPVERERRGEKRREGGSGQGEGGKGKEFVKKEDSERTGGFLRHMEGKWPVGCMYICILKKHCTVIFRSLVPQFSPILTWGISPGSLGPLGPLDCFFLQSVSTRCFYPSH